MRGERYPKYDYDKIQEKYALLYFGLYEARYAGLMYGEESESAESRF